MRRARPGCRGRRDRTLARNFAASLASLALSFAGRSLSPESPSLPTSPPPSNPKPKCGNASGSTTATQTDNSSAADCIHSCGQYSVDAEPRRLADIGSGASVSVGAVGVGDIGQVKLTMVTGEAIQGLGGRQGLSG